MVAASSSASSEKILAQLLDLGKKNKKENDVLEAFLEKLDWTSLSAALSWLFDEKNTRGATSAPDAVHYLYRGLTQESQRDKRLQATLTLLSLLRSAAHMPRASRTDVLHRLMLACDSLSGSELVAAATELAGSIVRGDDPHSLWRTTLPKLLALIAEIEQVPRGGEFVSGAEFRSDLIDELCEADWIAESLTPLAIMFTDIAPSPEQLTTLSVKFCAALAELAPPALVALAQQLLALLRNRGAPALFFALARYFNTWVYSPAAGANKQWLREAPAAEATLRLCVMDAAGQGHASLTHLLRAATKMAACPEQLLSPFTTAILLALSQLATLKEPCLKVLVAVVVRAADEQLLRADSAWVRSVTAAPVDPKAVFSLVIQHNHESERVMRGLVDLALRLLCSPAKASALPRARLVWAAGAHALVGVASRRTREMGGVVLAQLLERVREEPDAMQLIDCVREVVRAAPSAVCACAATTRTALAAAGRHPRGAPLVRALSPAITPRNASHDAVALRESLIIVLRKDLASNKLETRLTAVTSLVHLLRHLEVKDLGAISVSSQCSQLLASTSRDTTQAGASQSQRGFNAAEATCTDLLRALGRCFGQQAAVRQALYTGLGRSASRNPELLGYVHDMLMGHLSLYLEDGEGEAPLRFGACVDLTGTLKEPLGHLLLACARAVARSGRNTGSGARLRVALDSLADRLPRCHPEDLALGHDADGGSWRETLAQAQDCADALIAHVLLSWNVDSVGLGNKLAALVDVRDRLAEFAKPSPGKGAKLKGDPKSKRKRKKVAETQATQAVAAATQDDEAAKPGKPKARPGAGKQRAGVADHSACLRMLQLTFQSSVPWSSERVRSEAAPLRACALRLSGELVRTARLDADRDADAVEFASEAAKVLWTRAVSRLRAQHERDAAVAEGAARLLVELVALVADKWPRKLPAFFTSVAGESGLDGMLAALRTQLCADDEEPAEGVELALVEAVAALAEHLDPASKQLTDLLTWLEDRAVESQPQSAASALAQLSLLLRIRRRARSTMPAVQLGMARQLLDLVGAADYHRGGDEVFTALRLVAPAWQLPALSTLVACAKEAVTEAGWFAERLDAELVALSVHAIEDEVAVWRRERALCVQTGQLLKPLHVLAAVRLGTAPKMQRVLTQLLTALYACAGRLAKHFLARPGVDRHALQAAKFDVIVKLLGGHFSDTVSGFISSIQNKGVEEDVSARGKLKVGSADTMLPGITFQKETFERFLIRLSRVAKMDLMQHVKVNAARDFRLKKTLLLATPDVDESCVDTTHADTSRADTSRADKSRADRSRSEKSRAGKSLTDTSCADKSPADSSRSARSRLNTSAADTTHAGRDDSRGRSKKDAEPRGRTKAPSEQASKRSQSRESNDFSFSSEAGSVVESDAESAEEEAPRKKHKRRN